jgi:hypothetical protein
MNNFYQLVSDFSRKYENTPEGIEKSKLQIVRNRIESLIGKTLVLEDKNNWVEDEAC